MGGIHRLLLVLLLLVLLLLLLLMLPMLCRRNMLGPRGRPGELLEGPGQAGDVVDGRGGREGGWHRQGESHMLPALMLPPLVLMMPILMCCRRNYLYSLGVLPQTTLLGVLPQTTFPPPHPA